MSEQRSNFETAVKSARPNWESAIDNLNALAMFEMLPALAGLSTAQLDQVTERAREILSQNRGWHGSAKRIAWAADVVKQGQLPDWMPADLPGAQVDDAKRFLAGRIERKGPSFGNDGTIPAQFMTTVKSAIEAAWKLNSNADFVETFRATVSTLSGRKLGAGTYAIALNKMVINLADSTKNQRVLETLRQDAADAKAGAVAGPTPAVSFKDGTQVWIRMFSLQKGQRAVTANILHEAAHLVGAPGDPVAEFALETIHKKAGFPR